MRSTLLRPSDDLHEGEAARARNQADPGEARLLEEPQGALVEGRDRGAVSGRAESEPGVLEHSWQRFAPEALAEQPRVDAYPDVDSALGRRPLPGDSRVDPITAEADH